MPALSTKHEDDEAIGCKILPLSRLNNNLQLQDERDNLDRIRGKWQKIVATDKNFPALTEEAIRGLAIVVYPIGLQSHTCKYILMKTQNLKLWSTNSIHI